MLKLQRIVKDYQAGDTTVHALRGVSLQFRESEFVAILGPFRLRQDDAAQHHRRSRPLYGGRPHHQRQVSTKDLSRRATGTAYRNHTIGFVFQSYNLIPHQSGAGNVELALTLSGVCSRASAASARSAALETRRASATSSTKSRTRCPAARCSASPSRAPSSTTRTFCLRTSRPARSTPRRACRSWKSLQGDRAATASSSWSRTTPSWPRRYSTRIVRLLDGEYRGRHAAPARQDGPQEAQPGRGHGQKDVHVASCTALSLCASTT